MSAINKPILYSYWRSSCSWRVRIALNLKEIPHDIKAVSLIKAGGEQHSNEFRDINPMEQVPALHIDGNTLVESLNIMHYLEETRPHIPLMPNDFIKRAKFRDINPMEQVPALHIDGNTLVESLNIMHYLEETRPHIPLMPNDFIKRAKFRDINPMEQVPALHIDGNTLVESLNIMHYLEETRPHIPLMPNDFIKRAKVREICEVIASGIQPLQNLIVLIHVGEEKKNEWAQHFITRGFRAVEKLLSASAGKYCVGDDITLADCCLIPQVFNARRFHVDLRPFPTILRIDRELENQPAFRAAHPSNQPDCPPEAPK